MFRQWLLNGRRVRGLVKSLQTGSITLSTAQTSVTQTINLVDVNNALIFYGGPTNNPFVGTTFSSYFSTLFLTNGTTLTLTRSDVGDPQTETSTYTVLEFWPGVIRNPQRGSLVGNGTVTATISPVDLTRAMVITTGASPTAPGAIVPLYNVSLQNATTVQMVGASNANVGYQVWEWM